MEWTAHNRARPARRVKFTQLVNAAVRQWNLELLAKNQQRAARQRVLHPSSVGGR